MEHHGILGRESAAVHDPVDLVRIGDLKHQLAGGFQTGEAVEIHIEGFLEDLRQELSKFPAFGDDFNIIGGKAVAVQQDAEAFRQGAAGLLGKYPAHLRLGCAGE